MKHFLLVVFSVLSLGVFGQELTKGLVMPNPDGLFKSCCVYIPPSGLFAYDQPNGKQIAQLEQGTSDSNGEFYKAFIRIGSELTAFEYTNMYWLDMKLWP